MLAASFPVGKRGGNFFAAFVSIGNKMQMVMDGFLALGLLLAGFWVWSVRGSVANDRAEAEKQKAEAEKQKAEAEREAKLQRKGERLHCLSCGKTFRGPLPPDGCPNCRLAAFVVPEFGPS